MLYNQFEHKQQNLFCSSTSRALHCSIHFSLILHIYFLYSLPFLFQLHWPHELHQKQLRQNQPIHGQLFWQQQSKRKAQNTGESKLFPLSQTAALIGQKTMHRPSQHQTLKNCLGEAPLNISSSFINSFSMHWYNATIYSIWYYIILHAFRLPFTFISTLLFI